MWVKEVRLGNTTAFCLHHEKPHSKTLAKGVVGSTGTAPHVVSNHQRRLYSGITS